MKFDGDLSPREEKMYDRIVQNFEDGKEMQGEESHFLINTLYNVIEGYRDFTNDLQEELKVANDYIDDWQIYH